ncbi:MAG: rhomboid family protein [Deltaproteobacteria bacterium]|nr:rhomboid family protein [Deltaproteobacteria bacterium]
MNNLLHQKCYNHKQREAVARCPECKRFFCRECITEHDDRVLCADCLIKKDINTQKTSSALSSLFYVCRFISGTIILWLIFYYIGLILLSLPANFHEGTLWSGNWMDV